MNKIVAILIVLVIFSAFLTITCTGTRPIEPPVVPTTKAETARSIQETWQQKWEQLIKEAQKEGKVVIGSSTAPPVRDALSKAFTGKYGVALEFISGKPAELVPKLQAERNAGLYVMDLFMAGVATVVPLLGPTGALEKLDPVLVLPEVLDKKAWWGGDLLWADPDHFQVVFVAYPEEPLIINTDLVKTGEIKSYRDLLNPKWKGKAVMLDPTMGGPGNSFFTFVVDSLKDLELLRELGKTEPMITRDLRLQIEWVARGKYAIAIGVQPEIRAEFKKAGAPIAVSPVIEGTYLSAAGGGLSLIDRAPHPNAAKLFINWLLTKEGQTVISPPFGAQSAREDVPTDFLDPDTVRQPAKKYYSLTTVGAEVKKREAMQLAREMYGHLLK